MGRTFFVNIYPTNDRRRNLEHKELLKKVTSDSKLIGVAHTLVTVGDKRLDPWIVAQAGMAESDSFSPLIATNPLYTHPIEAAKKIISLRSFFENQVSLNIVSGSFFQEMKAMNDALSFEERGERLKEFFHCLSSLLKTGKINFDGKYYKLAGAEVYPQYNGPAIKYFVSGGLTKDFKNNPDVYFVKNIKPLEEMTPADCKNSGLAVGICARETAEEAQTAIKTSFPDDRRGEMLFEMSLNNNQTPWNDWLRKNITKYENSHEYCLRPMRNFWSAAPFIADSYENTAKLIKKYEGMGYSFFILDYHPDEAIHVAEVVKIFRTL